MSINTPQPLLPSMPQQAQSAGGYNQQQYQQTPQLSPQDMQDMILAAQAMQQGGEMPVPQTAMKMPKPSIIPMLIAGTGVVAGGILGYCSKLENKYGEAIRNAGRIGGGAIVGGAVGVVGALVVARSIAMKQMKAMEKMFLGMQGANQQIANQMQQPPQR